MAIFLVCGVTRWIRKGWGMKRLLGAFSILWGVLGFVNAAAAQDNAYTVNPGDVLHISVWKEDGLDRDTVLVLPDGSMQFPLVGNLMAGGKTVPELQTAISERIAKLIPDASVSVAVKEALGNVVDVIGQVNKPGELVLSHRTTVMQALSMAGGLTPYASHGKVIVLRRKDDGEISIPFPYDEISRGESLGQDMLLIPGDVIVVPDASLF